MANVKRIRLKIEDRIALAAIALLGREVLPAAYAMCHPSVTTTNQDSLSTMYSRWYNQPQAKAYRIELADIIARRAKVEGADLTTREGIISELVTSVKQASGREAISGLQSLAKLQGYDRPTEKESKEQRRYYLPYVSKCRTCELMKIYRRLQDEADE